MSNSGTVTFCFAVFIKRPKSDLRELSSSFGTCLPFGVDFAAPGSGEVVRVDGPELNSMAIMIEERRACPESERIVGRGPVGRGARMSSLSEVRTVLFGR